VRREEEATVLVYSRSSVAVEIEESVEFCDERDEQA